ncbi:MAG: Major Facilitator Superfamily protein [Methanoregula sp. PtaU1.Bin051]|nr:MAG: Major Facilitator Superfamily protein [Methanoregula sp. PtaU1.Bin051]
MNNNPDNRPDTSPFSSPAYRLIILLGIVAMLGDIVYEGARSVAGPFLFTLGASAFAVAFIAGFGEFAGYAIRIVTGYAADRSKRYWTFVIAGYALIAAIPLLVLAGSWEIAAVLLIVERIGKAVRSPAKDAVLSHAATAVGRGWGFGIHEALDQIGAVAGPLLFVLALAAGGTYRGGFALLAIPFGLLLVALLLAWKSMPDPLTFEETARLTAAPDSADTFRRRQLTLYGAFTMLTMAGFIVFPLLAYHYKALSVIPDAEIPAFYAIAMAVDAIIALIAGKAYDRSGLAVLFAVPVIGIAIPLTAFSPAYIPALLGAVLWGASMGLQETVLRAAVADFTPAECRGFTYGIFNTVYGAAWFAGSLAIGILYTLGTNYAIAFMVLMQCAAVPVLWELVQGRRADVK